LPDVNIDEAIVLAQKLDELDDVNLLANAFIPVRLASA
jgi:hypothetical protein